MQEPDAGNEEDNDAEIGYTQLAGSDGEDSGNDNDGEDQLATNVSALQEADE